MSDKSQLLSMIYLLIGISVIAGVMSLVLWLSKFFPHPKLFLIGTERVNKPLSIRVKSFKVSDLVYYRGEGFKFSRCHSYLRRNDVDMLDKTHLDELLVKEHEIPEQWKIQHNGQAKRFFFGGFFLEINGEYYVHFLQWDNINKTWRRGSCLCSTVLKSSDLIVAAKKI